MSRRYLTLNNYDGSITGLDGMPAGPNDVVSAGGLASIQHHWTQGMGGLGDRTTDVFAGTGERYTAGPYGNLYHPESHGSVHERHYGPHTVDTQQKTLAGQPYHWESKSSKLPIGNDNSSIENYTDLDSLELVDETPLIDENKSHIDKKIKQHKPSHIFNENIIHTQIYNNSDKSKISAYVLLILFLFAFITFDFWSETVKSFIEQYVFKGKAIAWNKYLLMSIIATVMFILLLIVMDIPLGELETSSLIPPF